MPPRLWGEDRFPQVSFPALIVREIVVVDLVRIIHDCWEAFYDLLCFGCSRSDNSFSSLLSSTEPVWDPSENCSGGGKTYAAQTRPEAIKPNNVVSASEGPLSPSTKNIPSGPLDPRFLREAVNNALIFSQISVLNLVISSGVNLAVPWPHRVAVILRYANCPTRTCTG